MGLQRELGQHLIYAQALPTEVGRFDTPTFSVHDQPAEGTAAAELLAKGHSKERRPDLEQFRQGLGTLDPAGVPLLTGTWPGKAADHPLYLPAWREMVQAIGHRHFLFVADCKAAALVTEVRQAHLNFSRKEGALEETLQLAGWRIYVTNVQVKQMSLEQAIAYYRDEWLPECGFHRFKRGSNPALPLWVRLPERITGLMFLLLVALQALALLHGPETVYAIEFCLPLPHY